MRANQLQKLRTANSELRSRYRRALKALAACYKAGHRNGWEDGPTNNEVFDEVRAILSQERLEQTLLSEQSADAGE